MLEFDACVIGSELPIGFGVIAVSVGLPSGGFVYEGLLVGNAASEALRREDAEFGLGHIEPTAVLGRIVPFEAFDEPSGFDGWKGFVE